MSEERAPPGRKEPQGLAKTLIPEPFVWAKVPGLEERRSGAKGDGGSVLQMHITSILSVHGGNKL